MSEVWLIRMGSGTNRAQDRLRRQQVTLLSSYIEYLPALEAGFFMGGRKRPQAPLNGELGGEFNLLQGKGGIH
ncbi:hypothetical protein HNR48_002698 [Pseudoteredinibacter isoporae]|uniref:Uncharacterized protein n=1 Tax=Pseudoteredinibacter isoporae TaxID=570281 RepID=A0A7X0JVC1_9GAMM|nr:hypothetical protein [Pseudoteredinibacter isoporae]